MKLQWTFLIAPIYKFMCRAQSVVMYIHVVFQQGPRWHTHPCSHVTVSLATSFVTTDGSCSMIDLSSLKPHGLTCIYMAWNGGPWVVIPW